MTTPNSTAISQPTHLALYVGEGGPISVALTCESLDDACVWVREHGGYAYNDAEDVLDLPAGAAWDAIESALVRDGWRTSSACEEGEWSIHRRA